MASKQARHPDYPTGCVVAYMRVSTIEQSEFGAGLDAQRAAIETYARRNKLTIDHWITDPGVSGAVAPMDRKGLADALSILRRCKNGALLVAKTDRVARMTADLLALRDLAEHEHWTLSAADGSVDWSTMHGRAMSTVMGAFAELERDMIRARTREGMAAKREQGVRLGRPATLPTEVRDRIAAERVSGSTFAKIAAGLNKDQVATARGGTSWYPSTVKAVCTSIEHDAYAQKLKRA